MSFQHKNDYSARVMLRFEAQSLADYFSRALLTLDICDVEGDIVECGAGAGESLATICNVMLEKRYKTRNIWGFDSFKGYPEPTEREKQVSKDKGVRPAGSWARPFEKTFVRIYATGYSRENPSWSCPCCPEGTERVNIVKGFFEETIPSKYEGSKIALLNLDCNLYESYKHCLESLYDKVERGGIVMFDEYKSPLQLANCPGASVAIDEFLGDKKKKIQKVTFANSTTEKYFIRKTEAK